MSIKRTIITTILALALVAVVAPAVTSATTIDDLMAQITSLTAQLQALQGGQQTAGTGGTGACTGVTFTRNLVIGSTGSDVKCLQQILNQTASTQVSVTGAGSPGNETSYFGGLTLAAVKIYQAAHGMTPANQVGPMTRAALNATLGGTVTPVTTLPAGCTSTAGFSPTTGASCATGVVVVTPTGAGLSVSIAANNPGAATVVADSVSANGAQALAPMLVLNFSSNGTTVTTLKLKRAGISSDNDLSNVYLYDGSTKLAEVQTVGSGYYTFNNPSGLFTVTGTRTVTVKADIADGTTSGKTIGLSVNAATDVVATGSAINGLFPLTGSVMTTATVTDLGKLTLAHYSDPGANIDPTTDALLWKFSLVATNQKIAVSQIKLNVIGTLNVGDITNLYLNDGITQIGAKVTGLSSDKTVTFDLSANPYVITAGQTKYISVRGDIVGGSSRTFYFSVRNSDDFQAIDQNYNVSLKVNQGDTFSVIPASATTTTITAGSLQINKATDAPTGNVAADALQVSFGKWTIKGLGEGIKVSTLNFNTTVSAGMGTEGLNNAKVLLDGIQVGVTKDLATNGATATATEFSFGNQFVVNAGQTRTLEIYADVQNGSAASINGHTVQVDLKVGSGNAIKLTSGASYNTPASTGNALTATVAALSTTKNSSVANITTIASAQNVTIGSWLITAGAAEGVNVTSIAVVDRTAGDSAGTQGLGSLADSLMLYSNGVAIGQVIQAPSSTVGATQTFSLSTPLAVAAGTSKQIDLVANVKGGAAWVTGEVVKVSSVIGQGLVSAQSITDETGAVGQTITLGTPTLTVALEASPTLPASALLVTGTSGATVGAWKLSASNVEALKVNRIVVSEIDSMNKPGVVKNLKLYVGGVQVGTTIASLTTGSPDAALFSSDTGLFIIPKGGIVSLVLKADITDETNAFTGNAATNGSTVQFRIQNVVTQTSSTAIAAVGSTSGTYATGAAGANYDANVMKVVASKPTFACVAGVAGCNGDTKTLNSVTSEVLRFSITADANDDVKFTAANGNNIRFTIGSGETTSTGRTFSLYDAATAAKVATDVVATPADGVTVDFSTGLDITIPHGTSKTFYVKTTLTDYATGGDTFYLSLENAAADLSWDDNSGVVSTATVDISDTYASKGTPILGGTLVKPAT